MTMPARVQLSRRKGFRLQEHAPGAIVVRRPTRWGNPFIVRECMEDEPTLTELEARERCTWLYDLWLEGDLELTDPRRIEQRAWILEHLPELAGHPLACTCPLPAAGEPDWCHGSVLLERSNPLPASRRIRVVGEPWSDHLEAAVERLYGAVRTITPAGRWAGAL